MKKEILYVLVRVEVWYDPKQEGDRRHMMDCAKRDTLVCNTLPNKSTSARIIRKPTQPTQ